MVKRRANRHRENRITTLEQVDTSPRDNGRVILWRNISVVIHLLALLLGTYLGMELRATRLDLAGKLQELDVCGAEQLRLRTNLTARDLLLGETQRELLRCDQRLRTCGSLNDQLNDTVQGKLQELDVCGAEQFRLRTNLTACDRELEETKRELLRSDQQLSTYMSLNEQLKPMVNLLGDHVAEARNERDAALQRQQRNTELLLVCDTRREALEDRLAEAQRRLGEAEQEKAERKESEKEHRHDQQHGNYDSRQNHSEAEQEKAGQKENEKESRHHQQHGNNDSRQNGSDTQERGIWEKIWDGTKYALVFTGKMVVRNVAVTAFGPAGSIAVDFLSGLL